MLRVINLLFDLCMITGINYVIFKRNFPANWYRCEKLDLSIFCSCKTKTYGINLTPVKTQLSQYNLTPDLMLFYHSNKIKA